MFLMREHVAKDILKKIKPKLYMKMYGGVEEA